jgi:hypothetical protein
VTAVRHHLRAFGRFWWEFLVGDTPELFVAVLVIVGASFALRADRTAAIVVLPALAVAALVVSAFRGRTRRAAHQPETVDGRSPPAC